MPAPDVIELSIMTPNRTVNICFPAVVFTGGKKIMKHRKITLKAIIVMLFAGGLITASSWAFAQGSITGSVRDLSSNLGIRGAIITAKDASTGALGSCRVHENVLSSIS
jgi:hypothetical protein